MANESDDQLEARAVLRLVTHDSGAREYFTASYRGQGDALAALRGAADGALPTVSERVRELRSTAFGRTRTPIEERAAADALAVLAAKEARNTADAAALRAAIAAVGEWKASQTAAPSGSRESLPDTPAKPSSSSSRGTRRWTLGPRALATVILGSMAIGALAVNLWSGVVTTHRIAGNDPGSSASPQPGGRTIAFGGGLKTGGATGSVDPGNLAAANAWLARSPTKADTFPRPGMIHLQSLSSVRHIKDVHENDTLITIWGAKDPDDGICLITGLPSGIFGTQCTPPKSFAEHGITEGFDGIEVSWDGISISVALPVSG